MVSMLILNYIHFYPAPVHYKCRNPAVPGLGPAPAQYVLATDLVCSLQPPDQAFLRPNYQKAPLACKCSFSEQMLMRKYCF